ncbi:UDP-glucosyltransferase 2 [Drosophila kikkawai]|uniref:UDP-glucosyltransferase 2 n=1 Tax=Drosophila kikkawai TaxID=30033 RepID=A0A6P4IQY5_DROKI|nr:UDP-glucosyltransferase 2 [Drosophila kikkawai]
MRLGCSWLVYLCLYLHLDLHGDLSQAANILGVFPYWQPSPFQVVRPLVRALVDRGHNVTMITPVGMPADIEGVRHIRVAMLNQHMHELLESDLVMNFFKNKWLENEVSAAMLYNMSEDILSDDGVQHMLQDRSERFDLVLLEGGNLDALNGLGEFYNATLMGFSSYRLNWIIEELAGNPAPSINEPISPWGYFTDHSLVSMFYNWIYIIEERLMVHLIVRPGQLRLFKKYFGYSSQKFDDLRARFSVFLVNNHFSLGRPRANVPNIIEIGGLHLSEAPEPCDEELQRFMDEAEDGVIYFSMGQDIHIRFLPTNMQQVLHQTFAGLKQRVVWKNELSTTPNKTDKIYMIAKTPQRQVLAHHNVQLFITQGGMLSLVEAVYSGVPMLGLPLFFDHFSNIHQVRVAGMAEVLDPNNLNVDSLTSTILELLENPKYAERAKEMSEAFRDRPLSPLETAVWWTEYALRHRNAALIRLNSGDISLMQYYRLDCLLTYGLRFGLVIGSVVFLGYILV